MAILPRVPTSTRSRPHSRPAPAPSSPASRPVVPAGVLVAAAYVLLAPLCAGAVHLLAWLWNARRHAVGVHESMWFFGAAEWSPPLGWVPWTLMALLASTTLVLAALVVARTRPQEAAGCP
jgi:hypothetical protein